MSRRWLIAHHKVTLHICITPHEMPMAQAVCAHPIRTQAADSSNHKVALLVLQDMWWWLCQAQRVQLTRTAVDELSTSGQHGTSMIFGEFGLLQGLGTCSACADYIPMAAWPTNLPPSLPKVSTGGQHRSDAQGGKQVVAFSYRCPPRRCELFAQDWKGQCWEKAVKYVTAFLPYCFQGFVLCSQMEWHFSCAAWVAAGFCAGYSLLPPSASFIAHCGAVRA